MVVAKSPEILTVVMATASTWTFHFGSEMVPLQATGCQFTILRV